MPELYEILIKFKVKFNEIDSREENFLISHADVDATAFGEGIQIIDST